MGRPLPSRKLPNHAEPSINLGTLIFGRKVESFVPLLAVDFFPIFVHFFWLAYLSTHCSACFLGVYFMALLNVFNMSSPREPLRMGLPIYQIRAVQTHSIKPLRPALGFFLNFFAYLKRIISLRTAFYFEISRACRWDVGRRKGQSGDLSSA